MRPLGVLRASLGVRRPCQGCRPGRRRPATGRADRPRSSKPTPLIWPMSGPSALTQALRDRLTLDEARVAAMAEGVRAVAALDDPIGEELDRRTLASGLGPAQGSGAAGRRRGRLRGAAERDHRLRGADDQERQRDRAAGVQLCRALERGAGGRGARGAGRGRAARGRDAAGRGRRSRGACRAGDPGGHRRPADPARRRRAEERAQGGRHGAGDLRRGRQLPRLRARRGRPGDGAPHRLQRQGATSRGLQCGRDAAGRRGRGCGVPAGRPRGAAATPGSSWSATSEFASWPAGSRSASRPTPTGKPSTST